MTTWVALLRAVNLGPHGRLAMHDLRALITTHGGRNARTYLQSGNAVFAHDISDGDRLAHELEQRLREEFGLTTTVMIRAEADIARIAANHPFAERQPDLAKLQVAFLSATPQPDRAATLTVPAGGAEQFHLTGRELYLHYPNGVGRSKLTTAYIDRRLGVTSTSRNWKTVTALANLATG